MTKQRPLYTQENLFFSDVWIKKDSDKDFDVTIDSFDGPKICEVVGWSLYSP